MKSQETLESIRKAEQDLGKVLQDAQFYEGNMTYPPRSTVQFENRFDRVEQILVRLLALPNKTNKTTQFCSGIVQVGCCSVFAFLKFLRNISKRKLSQGGPVRVARACRCYCSSIRRFYVEHINRIYCLPSKPSLEHP